MVDPDSEDGSDSSSSEQGIFMGPPGEVGGTSSAAGGWHLGEAMAEVRFSGAETLRDAPVVVEGMVPPVDRLVIPESEPGWDDMLGVWISEAATVRLRPSSLQVFFIFTPQ